MKVFRQIGQAIKTSFRNTLPQLYRVHKAKLCLFSYNRKLPLAFKETMVAIVCEMQFILLIARFVRKLKGFVTVKSPIVLFLKRKE